MVKTAAIIAVTAITALLGGLWYASSKGGAVLIFAVFPFFGNQDPDDIFAACRAGQVAGGVGSIGGPFTLVDHHGNTVTDAEVITGPTLLYFGYTYCPDVCPADTARNAEAVDLLDEAGYTVTPAMISIDPERDTPDVMADFVFNLHDRMIGLTGSAEQVRAASQAYKTFYNKQPGDEEFYLVDHSTFSYLVLPDEGAVEFFRREHTPEQIAEITACFIDAAQ